MPEAVRESGLPILFFDGVCSLCNGFVDFVMSRDRLGRFRIAALQGETARKMGALDAQPPPHDSPGSAETLRPEADALRSLLLWYKGRWYRKSDAALRVFAGLGGIWTSARALFLIPRPIRDIVYDFVARHRYRWFGKKETCRMPTPAERERFLP